MDYCIYCGKKLEPAQTQCPGCGHEIYPYRSIMDYEYHRLSAAVADEIGNHKAGFLSKGDQKKMEALVREGKVETASVVVEKLWDLTVSNSDDSDDTFPYANLCDSEGNPAPEAVRVFTRDSELPDSGPVLLHYAVKKEDFYVVIHEQTLKHFADYAADIYGMRNRETTSRDMPVLEGSLADRGAKLVGGLFGKLFHK